MTTTFDSGRVPHDAYYTPRWPVVSLLKWLEANLPYTGQILDPAAGDGAILAAARAEWNTTTYAIELRAECRPAIERVCYPAHVLIEDALAFTAVDAWAGAWAVTNPPFNKAAEFIESYSDREVAAFLVRLNFYASASRDELFAAYKPAHVLGPWVKARWERDVRELNRDRYEECVNHGGGLAECRSRWLE